MLQIAYLCIYSYDLEFDSSVFKMYPDGALRNSQKMSCLVLSTCLVNVQEVEDISQEKLKEMVSSHLKFMIVENSISWM